MAATQRKGLKRGVTGEWTIIAKVKPGHEGAMREIAKTRPTEISGKNEDRVVAVGTVHDYRWVLFDNDTRIMFMSNFDGEWDQYIDDFFATGIVREGFDVVLSHCEGYDVSAPDSVKKDWFQAQTQEAAYYMRAYPGSVKEIWKALELQKAFQDTLDDPGAAEALAHPALKPLLDLAAK